MTAPLRSTAISATIMDMIRNGAFPEGKLWAEDVLCEKLDVSRTTLREALKLLERDCIISKKHGLGNFVHKSSLDVRMRLDKFSDFAKMLEDDGYTVTISRGLPRPATPEEVLAFCGKTLPAPCLYQDKRSFADGHPATYALSYLMANEESWTYYSAKPQPTTLLPKHATLPFIAFMQDITGLEQAHSIIYVEPVQADASVSAVLAVPEGSPLISFVEEHYSLTDVLCGLGRVYFEPSIVRLSALRK